MKKKIIICAFLPLKIIDFYLKIWYNVLDERNFSTKRDFGVKK